MKGPEAATLDLVRRAQAGDLEAFEMLVEQHATAVYRLAAAIVGEAEARDIAQEAFTAGWRELPRLRRPEAFASWLRRICVNRSRNWLRAAARRGPLASLDSDPGLGARLTDPRADFRSAVEARALLEPAFEALSPDQRAVLGLHYGIGLSISEAADAMGIRTGTAKSRLNAGLEALRRALRTSPLDR